ncbi:CDGSH iron-sulfur domain-containing protein NEET [Ziziphus jujuba]|uniref:CDGSH iron-sulfur domain-containing protein NEET n=1 Tax=Ziziphus jujuba TaxID=326968 RepID=A0A6P3ZF55_ZIZJJ|nr:CDGSH iron-sulfur domain-containing protein NEET [Ziziphus jujuba]
MASIVSTVAVGMVSNRNSSMEVSRTSGIRGTDTSVSTHNPFNNPLSSFSYGMLGSRRSRSLVVVKAEAQSINPEIRKSEDKVVDSVVVTELAKPLTAYCRCWRSGTFPLCDGSHVKHNKASGDNVGPLLLKKQ